MATPDLIGHDFTADAPGVKLIGGITYIPTWQGFVYLATVIDCHTKMVASLRILGKNVAYELYISWSAQETGAASTGHPGSLLLEQRQRYLSTAMAGV